MGKKRKIGQLEAAQPQPAEPVVLSVDHTVNPPEPPKQIESMPSEVLPSPNEVQAKPAEQVLDNPPVPEIEAEPAEPPRKKRKKLKKQKQVDVCVEVAGEAPASSREVGLVPAELPPPNPTVESGAEISSNPTAEFEVTPAELNVEAKTEEVKKKKKKKKQKLREQVDSTPTTQCGDEVERNCEAKVVEEDEPVKKRKKTKRQKTRELMEMQGTVTGCVDDVAEDCEAKMSEGKLKGGNVDEQAVGEVERQSTVAAQCVDDVERNGEVEVKEEEGTVKKKRRSKKQKLGEVNEVQGTVTAFVDGVEKSGEAKINGVFQKPVHLVAKMKGSNEPVTVCVGVGDNVDGKIDEGGELSKLLAMHGLTTEMMEVQETVAPCVDGVEKSGEAKIKEAYPRPVHVVAVMEGSKEPVTVCVGVEKNFYGKINERRQVARLLAIHGLRLVGEEVENKKRKREENKMENAYMSCVDVGNNEEVTMPWLRETQELIPTSMEWRKRQLVLGLQQKSGTDKWKEKESTEVEQKKESRNEKTEEQTLEYPQVCVICRGKGHTISTCSELNQIQTNPECSQPLQCVKPKNGRASNRKKKNGNAEKPKNGKARNQKKKNGNVEKAKTGRASNRKKNDNAEKPKNGRASNQKKNDNAEKPKNGRASDRKNKNGKAEKLPGCPPDDTLLKDKSSDSKEGESIVKNGEAETSLGRPTEILSKEGTSGVKLHKSTVKNVEESSSTPEDIVMKDKNFVS